MIILRKKGVTSLIKYGLTIIGFNYDLHCQSPLLYTNKLLNPANPTILIAEGRHISIGHPTKDF